MTIEKKTATTRQAKINKQLRQQYLEFARNIRWRYFHVMAANETNNGEQEGFFKIASLNLVLWNARELFISAVEEAGKENRVETIADENFVYAIADPTDDSVNEGMFD